MAFVTSGAVERVFKQNGDYVSAGEKIVELDNSSLRADLAEAKISNSFNEQDLLVSNAYKKLLNDGLQAYLVSGGDGTLSAEVSGSYESLEEGYYDLKAYASSADSGFSLNISGLEDATTPISFKNAVPVGKRGLFIKFNDADTSYIGTTWRIEIPNKRSSNYISNLNAYESAKKNRDINNATTDVRVAGISADIEARILRAPFDGIVSKVDIKKGEIATSGQVVATVMSKDKYQVKVQVPEVDIVNFVPGLVAEITLDAYGDSVVFPAKVLSVDQSETKVDGVSVYEAKVMFEEKDSRVLSGMTANIKITKSKVEDVLTVPASFIESDKEGKFVYVLNGEQKIKTYVETGLRGVTGDVEIKSGLSEGQIIIGNFVE
jgi:multidrug efflux pump subunit AcrA (membrane-fusion protein)